MITVDGIPIFNFKIMGLSMGLSNSIKLKSAIELRNSVDIINRKNKIHIESIRSIKFGNKCFLPS